MAFTYNLDSSSTWIKIEASTFIINKFAFTSSTDLDHNSAGIYLLFSSSLTLSSHKTKYKFEVYHDLLLWVWIWKIAETFFW